MEELRTFLYPLGFLSAFFFGGRFILQWLQSERIHHSMITPLFWKLSLIGNLLMMLHSFIQIQYSICCVQGLQGVIAWRNLNFMQTKKAPATFSFTIGLFLTVGLGITLAFLTQEWIFNNETAWFRVPITPWQASSSQHVSSVWHVLGTLAYLLFSSRFWIQWWYAEKAQTSQLTLSFWRLSLCGAILSIIYFLRIGDSVNLIGPLFGLIPYLRNLMLMKTS